MKHKHELITIAAFIVVLFLFLICIAITNTMRTKKGDIDGDNQITITDLVIVNRAALGKETRALDYRTADMNSDGVIDKLDVEAVSDILLYK